MARRGQARDLPSGGSDPESGSASGRAFRAAFVTDEPPPGATFERKWVRAIKERCPSGRLDSDCRAVRSCRDEIEDAEPWQDPKPVRRAGRLPSIGQVL